LIYVNIRIHYNTGTGYQRASLHGVSALHCSNTSTTLKTQSICRSSDVLFIHLRFFPVLR